MALKDGPRHLLVDSKDLFNLEVPVDKVKAMKVDPNSLLYPRAMAILHDVTERERRADIQALEAPVDNPELQVAFERIEKTWKSFSDQEKNDPILIKMRAEAIKSAKKVFGKKVQKVKLPKHLETDIIARMRAWLIERRRASGVDDSVDPHDVQALTEAYKAASRQRKKDIEAYNDFLERPKVLRELQAALNRIETVWNSFSEEQKKDMTLIKMHEDAIASAKKVFGKQ